MLTGYSQDSKPKGLPRISFVIPTLNEAYRIKACIQSILASEYPSDKREIIVVDTGSTDATVPISRSLPGVNVIETHPEYPSAAAGLNEGMRSASGDYIQYVAADSELHPKWITHALAAFAEDTTGTLSVVGGQTIESKPYPSVFSYLLGTGLAAGNSISGSVLHNAGTGLIHRDVLGRTGYFNPRLVSEDEIDFGIRVANAGFTFQKIDRPMIVHHLDLSNSIAGLRAMLKRSWRLGVGWGQLRDLHRSNPHRIAYMRDNIPFFLLPPLLLVGITLLITSFISSMVFTLLIVYCLIGMVFVFVRARQFKISVFNSFSLAVWYLVSSPWLIGGYCWYLLTKPVTLRPNR